MEDSNILKNIIENTAATKASLANELGVSRQFIGQVCNGVRNLSGTLREQLRQKYPTFFDEVPIPNEITIASLRQYRKACGYTRATFAKKLHISEVLLTKIENGDRAISDSFLAKFKTYIGDKSSDVLTLKYDTTGKLLSTYTPTPLSALTNTVKIDKRLLLKDLNAYSSRIIELGDDTCYPVFPEGSKIIIDESHKEFTNGNIFAFFYHNQFYIRKISIADKIKCIALNKEYDAFYLPIGGNYDVIGKVTPNIRF